MMRLRLTLKEAERLAYAKGDVRSVAYYGAEIQRRGEDAIVYVEIDDKQSDAEAKHDNHKAG